MARKGACIAYFLTWLLLSAAIAGCDNSFEPFVEGSRYFIVNGYLDAAADTQFVRVNAIRETVQLDEGLNIVVKSTHLEANVQVTWRDSLVRLDDGSPGRLFYGLFTPLPGHTYLLDVTADVVEPAQAEVALPESPEPETGDTLSAIADPGSFVGRDTTLVEVVRWQGPGRPPLNTTLTYTVKIPETGAVRNIPLDYDEYLVDGPPVITGSGDTREITFASYYIFYENDYFILTSILGRTMEDPPLVLLGLTMELELFFPASGVVQGGAGRIGSVLRPVASWEPARQAALQGGFALPEDSPDS